MESDRENKDTLESTRTNGTHENKQEFASVSHFLYVNDVRGLQKDLTPVTMELHMHLAQYSWNLKIRDIEKDTEGRGLAAALYQQVETADQ